MKVWWSGLCTETDFRLFHICAVGAHVSMYALCGHKFVRLADIRIKVHVEPRGHEEMTKLTQLGLRG